jgi:predicted permease
MNSLLLLLRKIALLFRRQRFSNELEEEMAYHRELAQRQLLRDGMTAEEAGYAAQRQLGNFTRIQEQSRETIAFHFETAIQDLRYALRQLRNKPGFTITAILVLGLGLCASIAIFAFVDAALLKPLPYPDPARLVEVTESIPMLPRADLSYLDYLDWKRLNTVFTSFDVYTGSSFLLLTPTGTEVVPGEGVSAGFFRTLGVHLLLGHDFDPAVDLKTAPKTVILSYASWQKRFGGRKDIIGQTITSSAGSDAAKSGSGSASIIIGVLPQDFHFAFAGNAEFWSPLNVSMGCARSRGCHNLHGVARLKNGVTVQSALAQMKTIAADLEKQYPNSNRGQGAVVAPLSEVIVEDIRTILLVLLAGAGLLLLIAATNVASLLLVRSEGRKREIAIRGALGASQRRLIRQFVTESVVLVAAAGILGLGLAYFAIQLLPRLIPPEMLAEMPYLIGLGLSPHVLAFAAGIALFAAVIFSLAPMSRLRSARLQAGLSDGSRGSAGTAWRKLGANLVVLELAVAIVLLAGAGLLGRSLHRLLHVELGFQPDHLATLEIAMPNMRMSDADTPRLVALERQLIARVSALPGVVSAATAMERPVSSNGNTAWIRFFGRPYNGEHNEVNQRDVSSEFFSTVKAKLLRGRYFTDAEDYSKPGVVIINEALARKYFPGEDPLGKKIGDIDLAPKSIAEVIGVVEDIHESSLDTDTWPTIYLPYNQNPDSDFSLLVRTTLDESSVLPEVVKAIHQVNSGIATRNESTMIASINNSPTAYTHRSSAWLVGGFAALALLLGVVGLYGVIAYSVTQRTREIGVRMALGAERKAVYKLILKEAGWLVLLGTALGLVCAVPAGSLMRSLLFGVRSWDLPTLCSVAAILAFSAVLASYLPARRAASVNPVDALRAE